MDEIVLPNGKAVEEKVWAKGFIESLSKFGVVSVACRAVGVGRSTVYEERAKNPAFAKAWADAYDEAVDTLETMLWKRATTGDDYEIRTETFHDAEGNEITRTTKIHKVSDTAMIFALKGARPEKYRDNVRVEQSGPGGMPIQVELGPIKRTAERVEELLELARENEQPPPPEVAAANGH